MDNSYAEESNSPENNAPNKNVVNPTFNFQSYIVKGIKTVYRGIFNRSRSARTYGTNRSYVNVRPYTLATKRTSSLRRPHRKFGLYNMTYSPKANASQHDMKTSTDVTSQHPLQNLPNSKSANDILKETNAVKHSPCNSELSYTTTGLPFQGAIYDDQKPSLNLHLSERQTSFAMQSPEMKNSVKDSSQAWPSVIQSPGSISNVQKEEESSKSNVTVSPDFVSGTSIECFAEDKDLQEDCGSEDSYKTAVSQFDSCDTTNLFCFPSTSKNQSGDPLESQNEKFSWKIRNFYSHMDKEVDLNTSEEVEFNCLPQTVSDDMLVSEPDMDVVRNRGCVSPSPGRRNYCHKFSKELNPEFKRYNESENVSTKVDSSAETFDSPMLEESESISCSVQEEPKSIEAPTNSNASLELSRNDFLFDSGKYEIIGKSVDLSLNDPKPASFCPRSIYSESSTPKIWGKLNQSKGSSQKIFECYANASNHCFRQQTSKEALSFRAHSLGSGDFFCNKSDVDKNFKDSDPLPSQCKGHLGDAHGTFYQTMSEHIMRSPVDLIEKENDLNDFCGHKHQEKLSEAISLVNDTSELNLKPITFNYPVSPHCTKSFDARNENVLSDDTKILKTHQNITNLKKESMPFVSKPNTGELNRKRKLSATSIVENPNNRKKETWKIEKGTKKLKNQTVTPLILRRPSRTLKNQTQKMVEVPMAENRQNGEEREIKLNNTSSSINSKEKHDSCRDDSNLGQRSLFEDIPSSNSSTPLIKDNERRCYEVLSPKCWSPSETSTQFKLQSVFVNKVYKLKSISPKSSSPSFTESSRYPQLSERQNANNCASKTKAETLRSQWTVTNLDCEDDQKQAESESFNEGSSRISRSCEPEGEWDLRRNPGRKAKINALACIKNRY